MINNILVMRCMIIERKQPLSIAYNTFKVLVAQKDVKRKRNRERCGIQQSWIIAEINFKSLHKIGQSNEGGQKGIEVTGRAA